MTTNKNYAHCQIGRGTLVHLVYVSQDGTAARFPVCGAGHTTTGSRRSGRARRVNLPLTCTKCIKKIKEIQP